MFFIPKFNIGYSSDIRLKTINEGRTCDESLDIMIQTIKKYIKKIKKIDNFEKTKDYSKYKLFPGQQIRRSNLAKHSAIYIYDGLILETGSAPRKCSRKSIRCTSIKNVINGLSTIEDFEKYSKNKKKCHVLKVVTEYDSDKKEILARMNRALEISGRTDFNLFVNNCKHLTNYVTYNKYSIITGMVKCEKYLR